MGKKIKNTLIFLIILAFSLAFSVLTTVLVGRSFFGVFLPETNKCVPLDPGSCYTPMINNTGIHFPYTLLLALFILIFVGLTIGLSYLFVRFSDKER